ncbi:DNA topoisomerase 3 [Cytobacillus sp. FJAT-54145]|uniref:DNA topoisomerase n=1 Tax=Cytobacillus spartinae TaxID=3299023 RepID=A0ABW6KC15_9BACI
MKVILCEKPDQAVSVAAALKEVSLSNGEILETKHLSNPKYDRFIKEARRQGYLQGKNHIVTYAFGHLFTLKEPHEVDPNLKNWKADTLPFFFDTIPLKMSGGTMYKLQKSQFDTIKKLFNDPTTKELICSTDAGREGEHIFRTIYKMAKCKKPFTRMWLKDMTEKGILDAYTSRKDGKLYDGLADAAVCRAESDYIVGMNLTRAMTLKFGGFKNVLSIGRVQTPTLAILVKREQEIQNFVPEDYWNLKAVFAHPNGDYEGQWAKGKEDRFSKESDAKAILAKVKGKPGVITECIVKEEKENPPLLFNLTELQGAAGKAFGYNPNKTLELAQKLYDGHKLITYPRSSSRYLASGTGATTKARLEAISGEFSSIADKAIQNKWGIAKYMVNDSKTSDHEAIIPTQKKPNLSKLSQEEKNVYTLIVKRFVAAFYPPCVWDSTKLTTTVEGEAFKSSGKALKQAGWREVEGIPNSNVLPLVKEKDAVQTKEAKVEKKKTTPPSRIQEHEMPKIMANAGQFVEEDELKATLKGMGIGTEATRASIIEELIKRGYVKRDKKALVPTQEKGMSLLEVLPVETLASPEMTARWEQKLADVEQGKLTRAQFMSELKTEVEGMVASVFGSNAQKLSAPVIPKKGVSTTGAIAKCSCGGDIVENQKAYGCNNYKNGCKNTIWKNSLEKLGKKKITATEAKTLFTKGKTSRKVKLKSPKTGKEFEAFLEYKNNKVELVF